MPVATDKVDALQVLDAEGICAGPLSRDGEIRIRWKGDTKSVKKQRLDVSVFKDGFGTGRYSMLVLGDQKGGFKMATRVEPSKGEPEEAMPALHKLQIGFLGEEKGEAETRGAAGKGAKGSGRMMLSVNSFEPGLNYFVRVLRIDGDKLVPGPVVRVEAPVCPVDDFLEDRK